MALDLASRLIRPLAALRHVPNADALRMVTVNRRPTLTILGRLVVQRTPGALVLLNIEVRHRLDVCRTLLGVLDEVTPDASGDDTGYNKVEQDLVAKSQWL